MGRFGIEFSDRNNAPFKINQKRHYAAINHSGSQAAPDTAFQRGLAWASYYVLVFAALCVFNQPAMAGIVEKAPLVSKTVVLGDVPVNSGSWDLRETNTQ